MGSFAQTLQSCRDGDLAARETLFSQWRPLLWLQARRLLGGNSDRKVDANDVVQEALTQAFRDLKQFRGSTEGEWVAWLRKLVQGQASKLRRHHSALQRDADRETPLDETCPVDGQPDPLTADIQRERAARLAQAIAELPEAMREVVVRRVFEQQPFEEVARDLDRSPGATRVLWTRAIRQLRATLQGAGPDASSSA